MKNRGNKVNKLLLFNLALIISLSILCSGCTPLKRKFTRKKKDTKITNEAVPILEPIEYPEPSYSSPELYQQRYSLFQVWFKDLVAAIEDGSNNKKIIYSLNQVLLQIHTMISYLKPEKQENLKKIEAELAAIKNELQSPVSTLMGGTLKLKLESIGKAVRLEYSPKKMEDYMDSEEYDNID